MKKAVRKGSVISLVLMLILAMSGSVFAASGMTANDALKAALKDAKLTQSNVRMAETELSDSGRTYEVEFVRKANGASYDYEIRRSDGVILDKEVEYPHRFNASSKKVSKDTAYRKVAKSSGFSLTKVKSGSCRLVKSDGEYVYKIKFSAGKYRFEYQVLAPTGSIIEWGKELK